MILRFVSYLCQALNKVTIRHTEFFPFFLTWCYVLCRMSTVRGVMSIRTGAGVFHIHDALYIPAYLALSSLYLLRHLATHIYPHIGPDGKGETAKKGG